MRKTGESTAIILKERIFTYFCEKFKSNWQNDVNRDTTRNSNGGNKLSRYKTFKTDYVVETYVKCLMARAHRSALSEFRLGVAPIRVETGRYERLPVSERICFHCKTCVEDELHVLIDCPLYNELRLFFFFFFSSNVARQWYKYAREAANDTIYLTLF